MRTLTAIIVLLGAMETGIAAQSMTAMINGVARTWMPMALVYAQTETITPPVTFDRIDTPSYMAVGEANIFVVRLAQVGAGPLKWSISWGDGATSTATSALPLRKYEWKSFTHTYTSAGPRSVVVLVTDIRGIPVGKSVTVTAYGLMPTTNIVQ